MIFRIPQHTIQALMDSVKTKSQCFWWCNVKLAGGICKVTTKAHHHRTKLPFKPTVATLHMWVNVPIKPTKILPGLEMDTKNLSSKVSCSISSYAQISTTCKRWTENKNANKTFQLFEHFSPSTLAVAIICFSSFNLKECSSFGGCEDVRNICSELSVTNAFYCSA